MEKNWLSLFFLEKKIIIKDIQIEEIRNQKRYYTVTRHLPYGMVGIAEGEDEIFLALNPLVSGFIVLQGKCGGSRGEVGVK